MKRLQFLVPLLALLSVTASSQLIEIRTYPVLSDNTVFALPQRYTGMAGVSIGLRDDYSSPFNNPAAIMLSPKRVVAITPRRSAWDFQWESVNTWSNPTGSYTTTNGKSASNLEATAGALWHDDATGIAALINYQTVKSSTLTEYGQSGYPSTKTESSFGASNFPFSVAAAARIPGTSISLGAAYSAMDLRGFDGVQFLYPGSKSVTMSGSVQDIRGGVATTVGDALEIELLGGRSTTTSDQTATYDYNTSVTNKEDTKTTFAQVTLRMPVAENLTVGVLALGNWTDMPKLPDYPLAGVPRDPGTIIAANFGVGLSWKAAPSVLFAADLVFEPAKIDTWVEAQADRVLPDNTVLARGSVEQRNNYRFWNQILRLGIELQPASWMAFRFGSAIHFYSYDYYFKSYLWNQERTRSPQLQWTETKLTGGLAVNWGSLRLSYAGEYLLGRGVIEADYPIWYMANEAAIVLVPNDWMVVRPVPVFAHQVSVMYFFE